MLGTSKEKSRSWDWESSLIQECSVHCVRLSLCGVGNCKQKDITHHVAHPIARLPASRMGTCTNRHVALNSSTNGQRREHEGIRHRVSFQHAPLLQGAREHLCEHAA